MEAWIAEVKTQRAAEVRAVKAALAKAGIKASVKHGRGSIRGWLCISVELVGQPQHAKACDGTGRPCTSQGEGDCPVPAWRHGLETRAQMIAFGSCGRNAWSLDHISVSTSMAR